MTRDPNLDDAYALSGDDDVLALYKVWAASYDAAFGDAQGYQIPRHVALAFVAAGGQGPVLDVGAGTGLVGEHLSRLNIGPLDGVDLSDDMLAIAGAKGLYRHLIRADITKPLALLGGPYDGIISAGTFTLGHVGTNGLAPLLDVAASGCVIVLSINSAHFEKAGFASAFSALANRITTPTQKTCRIYDDRADEKHRMDTARIVTFRVL